MSSYSTNIREWHRPHRARGAGGKQMTPWFKARRCLPVIRCMVCRRPLARLEVHAGHTCIRIAGGFATMARLVCACGGVREWASRRV